MKISAINKSPTLPADLPKDISSGNLHLNILITILKSSLKQLSASAVYLEGGVEVKIATEALYGLFLNCECAVINFMLKVPSLSSTVSSIMNHELKHSSIHSTNHRYSHGSQCQHMPLIQACSPWTASWTSGAAQTMNTITALGGRNKGRN